MQDQPLFCCACGTVSWEKCIHALQESLPFFCIVINQHRIRLCSALDQVQDPEIGKGETAD